MVVSFQFEVLSWMGALEDKFGKSMRALGSSVLYIYPLQHRTKPSWCPLLFTCWPTCRPAGSLGFLCSYGFHDYQTLHCFSLPQHHHVGPIAFYGYPHLCVFWNVWDIFHLVSLQTLPWIFGPAIYCSNLFLCGDLESFKKDGPLTPVFQSPAHWFLKKSDLFGKDFKMYICKNDYLEITGKLNFFRDILQISLAKIS